MKTKKTALVLGGGGSRGAYEIGVWQALRELGIKIDIVTGTSVGAINGAVVAQNAFEPAVELWKALETNMVFDLSANDLGDYLKGLITGGTPEYTSLKKLLSEYIDEDAIRASDTELGIVTVEVKKSFLAAGLTPHHLFREDIPTGKLLDYILASAACFPAVKGYKINDKLFIDGGYSDNLPAGMAVERGASQIITVNLDSFGFIKKNDLELIPNLLRIESPWDLGNFLIFDQKNSRYIMRLGYLDTMKAHGVFDGKYYTFIKGTMNRRAIKNAEQAARIFEINPEMIYSKEIFNLTLAEAVSSYLSESHEDALVLPLPLSGINSLLKKLNPKSITILAARAFLTEGDDKNSFLTKSALALIKEEVPAAHYLLEAEIVQ